MLLAVVKNLLGKGSPPENSSVVDLADEDLMLRYAKGDVAAFEALLGRHERAVFYFILRSCGQHDQAEELLQETFLRVIKYAEGYKPTAKFTTWLYTIARNLCIDKARKHNKRTEISMDAPAANASDTRPLVERMADPQAASAGVDYERQAFRERLNRALEELPEEQREVFILREFSGLKFHEIAETVGCKVPTVKSRMRYALQTLRGHLADYVDHSFDREEAREVAASD